MCFTLPKRYWWSSASFSTAELPSGKWSLLLPHSRHEAKVQRQSRMRRKKDDERRITLARKLGTLFRGLINDATAISSLEGTNHMK